MPIKYSALVFIYNIGIQLYYLIIWVASFFNQKARLWIEGRKDTFNKLNKISKDISGKKLVWIHCASLGEFEQGRPLIEAIKTSYADTLIFLTFYSPSGYEIRKNYAFADFVFYLPLDTPVKAKKFIATLNPDIAIFVKYEFWYHFLKTLVVKNIPTFYISTLFRPNQYFFKWYGLPFRKILTQLNHIFLQNAASAEQLREFDFNNFSIAGDTRVDRVWNIAQKATSYPIVESFQAGSPMLVVGSSWPADEEIISEWLQGSDIGSWKIIIAPHQIDDPHIDSIQKLLKEPSLRYSKLEESIPNPARILIIDNIGMLSSIYQYGTIAYIGGGFGKGIHNTLEPIAFGLPVLFGPKYEKFEEARFLVDKGGGYVVESSSDLNTHFQNLQKEVFRKQASQIALSYIENNKGSTQKIMKDLSAFLNNGSL